MSLSEVESLLCQKVGMDANIIGSRKIAKAIETRLAVCRIDTLDSYLKILRSSPAELDELVELLVIPETWFFRDRTPFEFVVNYISSLGFPKSVSSKVRLLSVPCSTGEEPYSLAMKFLDMGILPNQFEIDAVDISHESLAKAKKGIYNRNSFRGDNLEFRSRYFTHNGSEYHLCEQVKNSVDFSYGNLLNPSFLSDKKPYDLIFCRNVLIYFDSTAKSKTITTLHRLLKPEGFLLVGASETRLLANLGFTVVRNEFGFAGQKKDPGQEKSNMMANLESNITSSSQNTLDTLPSFKHSIPDIVMENIKLSKTSSSDQPVIEKTISPIPKNVSFVPEKFTDSSKINLGYIRNLADNGNLPEAVILCNEYLQNYSTSVEAYVLLGQIYQAQGKEIKAEALFEKAIYLDPKNYQALLHLALLKEQSGELAKADILRQRIRRLENI